MNKYKVTKGEIYLAIDCKPDSPLFPSNLDSREFIDYEDHQAVESQRELLLNHLKFLQKHGCIPAHLADITVHTIAEIEDKK